MLPRPFLAGNLLLSAASEKRKRGSAYVELEFNQKDLDILQGVTSTDTNFGPFIKQEFGLCFAQAGVRLARGLADSESDCIFVLDKETKDHYCAGVEAPDRGRGIGRNSLIQQFNILTSHQGSLSLSREMFESPNEEKRGLKLEAG